MKFKEIARNLREEGMKFKWGTRRLVTMPFTDEVVEQPSYCAVGIKAAEFGVPNVALAFYDSGCPDAEGNYAAKAYRSFEGLETVVGSNDMSYERDMVCSKLDKFEGEADIEGFVAYLKSLIPEAIEWAKKKGYNSLLKDLSC